MGESRKRLVGFLVCAFSLLACASATASPPPESNRWLDQRGILNMAHQGGEFEAPSSTMYAFRTALEERGADSLEMDVNATADNRLAVMHDYYTSKITPLDAQVRDLTLSQLQGLDAAYWFSPGTGQFDHSKPVDQYPLRGVRTGSKPPPEGYSADDFRIPTIEEVLTAFPKVPLNIEIKSVPGDSGESLRVAGLLGEILARPENRDRPIIVASLDQDALVRFRQSAPTIDVSAGMTSMISFLGGGSLADPKPMALQVPMRLGEFEPARELQKMDARGKGLAVHVWTDGAATEVDEAYANLIDAGVQGIMTSAPSRLHNYLCRAGVRRPSGDPRCDQQRMRFSVGFPTSSLKRFLLRGMPVRAICDQECDLLVRVKMRAKAAKRLGIKSRRADRHGLVMIGENEPKAGYTTSSRVIARPGKQAKARLSRVRRVDVQVITWVTDPYGKTSTQRSWLTLKSKRPLKPRR